MSVPGVAIGYYLDFRGRLRIEALLRKSPFGQIFRLSCLTHPCASPPSLSDSAPAPAESPGRAFPTLPLVAPNPRFAHAPRHSGVSTLLVRAVLRNAGLRMDLNRNFYTFTNLFFFKMGGFGQNIPFLGGAFTTLPEAPVFKKIMFVSL